MHASLKNWFPKKYPPWLIQIRHFFKLRHPYLRFAQSGFHVDGIEMGCRKLRPMFFFWQMPILILKNTWPNFQLRRFIPIWQLFGNFYWDGSSLIKNDQKVSFRLNKTFPFSKPQNLIKSPFNDPTWGIATLDSLTGDKVISNNLLFPHLGHFPALF